MTMVIGPHRRKSEGKAERSPQGDHGAQDERAPQPARASHSQAARAAHDQAVQAARPAPSQPAPSQPAPAAPSQPAPEPAERAPTARPVPGPRAVAAASATRRANGGQQETKQPGQEVSTS